MRVSTKDFYKLKNNTDPIIEKGQKDHQEYIEQAKSPNPDDSEIFVRNTLEQVLDEVKEWFKDQYDFVDSDFDNFPSLDQLIWHESGWNLHDAILGHYATYNKYRNKQNLINSINRIIHNESDRLRNSVWDTLNERSQRFSHVLITGENRCGGCGDYYGEFKVGSNLYILPPFHDDCGCFAIYYGGA